LAVTSCEECDFVYEDLAIGAIPGALRAIGPSYRAAFARIDPVLAAQRGEPDVWSALEYVCHLRDVLLVQRERVVLAQVTDRPTVASMSRDERVSICRYDTQPLAEVLDQLTMAAGLCALTLEGLAPAGWQRQIVYPYPQTEVRTMDWVGRHAVHEGRHHLGDVQRVLAQVGQGR
jgi:hypothetical protein